MTLTYICNFAADNSLHSMEDNVKEVKIILNKNLKLLKVRFFSEPYSPKSEKMP